MIVTSTGMSAAMRGLQQAVDGPREPGVSFGNWRWLARQRMAALRDALAADLDLPEESWLAARGGNVLRERRLLLTRLAVLGPAVLESPDADQVRGDLRRLLSDVARHVQRLHDLAYDDVELELGGEE